MDNIDRIRGGFLGLFLGDALGAPYEFRYSYPLSDYNGTLYQPIKWRCRYGPMQYSAVGQVTDDSTMSISLLRTILENGNWNEDAVIQAYINWANSGIKFLGRNTRALFHGIKTITGYRNRYARIDLSNVQSNGSLMRAYPLILLFLKQTPEQAYQSSIADTNLTNPNQVNRDATIIYLTILRYILHGIAVQQAIPEIINLSETQEIRDALIEAVQGKDRDIIKNKGWVAHPIYLIIQGWIQAEMGKSYREIINWVIRKGGDTDTNGAIVGSVMGTYFGENKLRCDAITNKNIDIVLGANYNEGNFPLSYEYHPGSILGDLK